MNRQRGFAEIIIYAVAIAAAVAAIWGAIAWHANTHFQRGVDHERVAQADRNKKAQDEADSIKAGREDAARVASAKIASADARADNAEAQWRIERAKRKPVAAVVCPEIIVREPGSAVGSGNPVDRVGPVITLTTDGLRLWDAAWTDQDGKPVFAASGEVAGAASQTVTVDAAIDNHAENASRCSAANRRYNELIDLILKYQGR